jgi:cell division septation protein DedD
MSYDFSFDKKSAFLILGSFIAIGALLFFAGFVVGWNRGNNEARLSAQQNTFVAQNPPITVNAEGPEKTENASTAAGADSVQAEAASAKSTATLPPAAEADPKISKANSDPPSGSIASLGSPKNADADAVDGETGFSLQVGAFQDEGNAQRCETNLKSRGYPAFTFNTLDAGGRSWHTVRIGHYPDVKKAAQAAVTFTGKEKLPAFIRPVNEL